MRLLSLTVRNYRVHKETSVTFDPSRNLIGGPNESGKSTLVEAAHRALFLRAKTGGGLQREMVSTRHPGEPEVVLNFDACGSRWEIRKRFAATRGSAILTESQGAVYRDDEAETKLEEILKCETNGGRVAAGQLPLLWAHLWVWQGSSGNDPALHASHQKDNLIQGLQQGGVSAVMQSDADRRAREAVERIHEALFTNTGRPKAGSAPESARLQMEAARENLARAQAVADRLKSASETHEAAENDIRESAAALPGLRESRVATEAALSKVAELRRLEEGALHGLQSASQSRELLVATDARIRSLHLQAEQARQALEPAAAKELILRDAGKAASEAAALAESAHREATRQARQSRLRHDLANAAMAALEKSAAHRSLAARSAEAGALRDRISTCRGALDRLPQLGAAELKSLRKVHQEAGQVTATLEAMATGIELVQAELPVLLDGKPLTLGQSRILTDSGELLIGAGTTLRIRPGGGNSLAEARQNKESCDRKLSMLLERHGLRDLDHGASVSEQRQALEQELAGLEARWKGMGGETVANELATATTALHVAEAELGRRIEAADLTFHPPATVDEATQVLAAARDALGIVEQAETSAGKNGENHRARQESAARALQSHREQFAAASQELRDLETRMKVLEESHGEPGQREARVGEARETEALAATRLAEIRKSLAGLAPESLQADLERYTRAIAGQQELCRKAEDRRLTARAQLSLDGSSDPQAELSHALARFQAASDLHAGEFHRAQAIAMLHRLFAESRDAIDHNLSQPLADRIAGYLQCIFGPSARLVVSLSDHGIEKLELVRADDPTFGFATLSGGAREQVAAAVRLAMAEILAADHDGCLPLVFDDAFAYSDRQRTQALLRMLDHAARQGLQVILLTCSPSDYSGLGAGEIRLDGSPAEAR